MRCDNYIHNRSRRGVPTTGSLPRILPCYRYFEQVHFFVVALEPEHGATNEVSHGRSISAWDQLMSHTFQPIQHKHAYKQDSTHTQTHTRALTHMHAHTHTHTHTCNHARTCTCVWAPRHTRMHTHMQTHTRICMYRTHKGIFSTYIDRYYLGKRASAWAKLVYIYTLYCIYGADYVQTFGQNCIVPVGIIA